ncbi:hypothetical protein M422DRAFT_36222 [Sphaerobolus stellatus SS14]|uniref:Transcription elongation factor n=1 Tax=Sphaerobolus stellatus (strain SS14) TaxID=990650 RepID=A0A0C9UQV1_SPHS4|nr:hypothetical protein M422DRAFT_36222 [Sphaerobolus stellatus SS14]
MTDVGELKSRVKAMQNSSTKDIIDCLIWLKKNVIATESLLRETKAGLAVGKLRTHQTKEIADLAKELVKKWKSEVDRAKHKAAGTSAPVAAAVTPSGSNSAGSTPQPTTSKPSLQVDATKKAAVGAAQSPTVTSPNSTRTADGDGVSGTITGDSIRDKCIVMLYNAMCSDSGAPIDQILSSAKAVEIAVLAQNKNDTGTPYRAKVRSLFLNLKDKSNPGLREAVVSGEISATRLVNMSSKDLASEERKAADKKITEANFFNTLGSLEQAAETDAFQCGRCKQRKTRYRQQQTRSADEPMTTFVTCVNCGNRWKFS